MSQRRSGSRGNRKGRNRYNPNAPDYRAVHAPWSVPRPAPAPLPLFAQALLLSRGAR